MLKQLLCCGLLVCGTAALLAAAKPVEWRFPAAAAQWKRVDFEALPGKAELFPGHPRKPQATLLLADCDIDAAHYDTLFVAVRGTVNGAGTLRFAAADTPGFDADKARSGEFAGVEADTRIFPRTGEFRLIRFELDRVLAWKGKVKMLRIDFKTDAHFDPEPGDRYEIAFITLAARRGNGFDNGDGALRLDGRPIGWEFAGNASYLPEQQLFRAAGEASAAAVPFASLDRQGSFSFSFDAEGGAGSAVIDFIDIDGKPLSQQKIAIPAAAARRTVTARVDAPDDAAWATVTFRPAGKEEMRFGNLAARRLITGSIISRPLRVYPQTWWFSKWIMPRERPFREAWLRRAFTVPEKTPVKEAEIQFAADDRATVYLNGAEIAKSSGNWRQPTVLKLDAAGFKTGENLLEVKLENADARGGFIAELRYAFGSRLEVLRSSSDWTAATDGRNGTYLPCRIESELPRIMTPYRKMSLQQRVKLHIEKLPKSAVRGSRFLIPVRVAGLDTNCEVGVGTQVWQNDKIVYTDWYQPRLRNGRVMLEVQIPYSVKPGVARIRLQPIDAICSPAPILPIEILPNPDETKGFPTAKIASRNGTSVITVDGKEIPVTQALYGESHPNQFRFTADAGIHLWGVWVHNFGFTQKGDDFSKSDEIIYDYLRNDPNAYLIINTIVDTRYHPWWLHEHPEARARLDNGSDNILGIPEKDLKTPRWGKVGYMPSYASPVWRKEFGDALRRFIRHVAKQPYAHRVVGIQVCNGHTSEWFNWGCQSQRGTDYSECNQLYFREWLKKRYGTVDALRKAWRRTDVTFETASIPPSKRRIPPEGGVFFDPATHQDVIDYNDYQNFLCCDTIRHFMRVIKEESSGKLLAGTYYGYVFHLSEGGFFGQNSGHFDSRRFLDAAETDFTVSPISYGVLRRVGNTASPMILTDSWNLAGKIAWNQDDFRTQWSDRNAPFENQGNIETILDAKRQMERELARNLAEGNAMQYYDFSRGWIMGDKRLMRLAKRLAGLTDRYRANLADFAPENYALLVVDESQVAVWNWQKPPYDGSQVNLQRWHFIRSGVPWKAVLFSDLMKHPELLRHKVICFMNAMRLDDAQIRFLKEKVLKDGRLAIFSGPVGIVTPKGFGPAAAQQLFGGRFRVETEAVDLQGVCTGLFPEIEGERYGIHNHRAYPDFLLPDGKTDAKVFAKLADGRPAALYWEKPDCRILWTAVPTMNPRILRALARRHGLPVISDGDDAVYTGHGCVGIHAAYDGVKKVKMLAPGNVRELFTDRVFTPKEGFVELPMKRGETRIFVPAPR